MRYGPALALHAAVLLLGVAMLWEPGKWGGEDWDYFAHHYEAMRRSVLEYRQVPWWNPWSCGGLPLATNPQLGLISINFPLVLIFGTYPGLKLAVLLHLIAAAEGARWLAGLWFRDELARAVVAFIYVFNGSVALYVAAGHLGIELIAFVPWAIGLAFWMERAWRWGFALGAVLAVAVLESFQYFVVYLVMMLVGLIAWRFWISSRDKRRLLLLGCLSAGAMFLALAGMRTVLVGKLIRDFPRTRFSIIHQHVSLQTLGVMFVRPGQNMDYRFQTDAGTMGIGWHEYGCYVGVLPCVLFAASIRQGWRWWHTLTLACFWLALGNDSWYLPSDWLTHLPVLNTLRVASRWRVVGVLGIALGCGAALAELRESSRKMWRMVATGVAGLIALDLFLNAWPVYRNVFLNEPMVIAREANDRGFVQIHHENLPVAPKPGTMMMATLLANYGVIYSYEPVLGQGKPLSGRVWQRHKDYQAEYWSPDGPVELVRWSPNAISLRAPPHAEVHVNQNPGSYWFVNGQPAFPQHRSVDRQAPFQVPADSNGVVELSIVPSGFSWGWAATSIGLLGVVLIQGMHQKLHGRQSQDK